MKRVIEILEVVGTIGHSDPADEVCASANAHYDELNHRVIVDLDSFVRRSIAGQGERRSKAEWLPGPEVVQESVPALEASDLARDVFERWVGRVRRSMPDSVPV